VAEPCLGDGGPGARIASVEAGQPVARAVGFHPVALVAVGTCAEIDQFDTIDVDCMLEQRGA